MVMLSKWGRWKRQHTAYRSVGMPSLWLIGRRSSSKLQPHGKQRLLLKAHWYSRALIRKPSTLSPLYQSIGGELIDEDGQVTISPEPLLNVLEFFESSQAANLMPFWLTQFDSDVGAWNEFAENRANLAVTWWTRYINSENS